MNVWKSLFRMFGFSGWNCLKDYEDRRGGSDTDNPPITDDCQ